MCYEKWCLVVRFANYGSIVEFSKFKTVYAIFRNKIWETAMVQRALYTEIFRMVELKFIARFSESKVTYLS